MRKKTQEEFEKEVYDLVGNEYTVLGNYLGDGEKILVRHNLCQYKYSISPNDFLKGSRCKNCLNQRRTKSNEQFLKEVCELVGSEYTFLEAYKKARTKILVRHNVCGYEYLVSPNHFFGGRRCIKCTHHVKKDTDYFKQEVFELVGEEYKVIGEYVYTNTNIIMKHTCCGYEYPVTPHNFLRGTRCPSCNLSKGETEIQCVLDKNNIYSISQKEFDTLIGLGGKNLSYDFYLPYYNLLIEYQGIQHQEFTPGLHIIRQTFEKQLEHDRRKREYAKNNNINLLEIWYWDFDKIEQILLSQLELSEKDSFLYFKEG